MSVSFHGQAGHLPSFSGTVIHFWRDLPTMLAFGFVDDHANVCSPLTMARVMKRKWLVTQIDFFDGMFFFSATQVGPMCLPRLSPHCGNKQLTDL